MTQPIATSTIGVRNRASFNGAGATTVDMAAFGESAQKWAVARDGQSSKQRPNEAERRARPIIISADHARSLPCNVASRQRCDSYSTKGA